MKRRGVIVAISTCILCIAVVITVVAVVVGRERRKAAEAEAAKLESIAEAESIAASESAAAAESEAAAAEEARNRRNSYITTLGYLSTDAKLLIKSGDELMDLGERIWMSVTFQRSDPAVDWVTKDGDAFLDFDGAVAKFAESKKFKDLARGMIQRLDDADDTMRRLKDVPDGLDDCATIAGQLRAAMTDYVEYMSDGKFLLPTQRQEGERLRSSIVELYGALDAATPEREQ